MNNLQLLQQWHDLDMPFQDSYCNGNADLDLIESSKAKSNIFLTATHAVNHYKSDGSIKPADLRTGGLCKLLAKLVPSNFICRNKIGEFPEEKSCWQELEGIMIGADTPLILDLHGAAKSADFDLAIGTGFGKITAEQLLMINKIEHLSQQFGVNTKINPEGYSAGSPRAITNLAKAHGYNNVLQLEWNRNCRSPNHSQNKSSQTLNFMTELLRLT